MRTSDIFFELARDPSNTDLQNSLMELIKKYNMAEYYKEVVEQLHYPFDEALYQSLQEKNKADIQEIDKKIETAKEAKSVDDVLDLYIAKVCCAAMSCMHDPPIGQAVVPDRTEGKLLEGLRGLF